MIVRPIGAGDCPDAVHCPRTGSWRSHNVFVYLYVVRAHQQRWPSRVVWYGHQEQRAYKRTAYKEKQYLYALLAGVIYPFFFLFSFGICLNFFLLYIFLRESYVYCPSSYSFEERSVKEERNPESAFVSSTNCFLNCGKDAHIADALLVYAEGVGKRTTPTLHKSGAKICLVSPDLGKPAL